MFYYFAKNTLFANFFIENKSSKILHHLNLDQFFQNMINYVFTLLYKAFFWANMAFLKDNKNSYVLFYVPYYQFVHLLICSLYCLHN